MQKGYKLTTLGQEAKEGKQGAEGKAGPAGQAGADGKAGAEGKEGPEGGAGFSTEQREKLKAILPYIKYTASGIAGKPTIVFSGVNVQVVDGEGKTESDVILDEEEEFTSVGGMVMGYSNTIAAPFATVTGGEFNAVSGDDGSVGGGELNSDTLPSKYGVTVAGAAGCSTKRAGEAATRAAACRRLPLDCVSATTATMRSNSWTITRSRRESFATTSRRYCVARRPAQSSRSRCVVVQSRGSAQRSVPTSVVWMSTAIRFGRSSLRRPLTTVTGPTLPLRGPRRNRQAIPGIVLERSAARYLGAYRRFRAVAGGAAGDDGHLGDHSGGAARGRAAGQGSGCARCSPD